MRLTLENSFARAMAHVEAHRSPVLIGLSGGSDSLALCALAAAWARSGHEVHACVIDHGVRANSHRDAEQAMALAQGLGLPCAIRTLHSPGTSQAQWRRGRLQTLADQARALGCGLILLGHTRDDQLETVALRQQAASGLYGLAGMAWRTPLPWMEDDGNSPSSRPAAAEARDLMIARPLLGQSRQTLREWLVGKGLHWIEDSSNFDPRFARVRMRQHLCGPQAGLLAMQEHAAAYADALDADARALVADAIMIGTDGKAVIDTALWTRAAPATRAHVWQGLSRALTGRAHLSKDACASLDRFACAPNAANHAAHGLQLQTGPQGLLVLGAAPRRAHAPERQLPAPKLDHRELHARLMRALGQGRLRQGPPSGQDVAMAA